MSRESERVMAVAAGTSPETPRLLGEPEMVWCPVCGLCYEADEIQHVLIPGSDGEANAMCWGCWDASGRRPTRSAEPLPTPKAEAPQTTNPERECSYCGVMHTNDHPLCTRCYVESHL